MLTVRDLLRVKGNTIWSISPDTQTIQALNLMTEKNVGALLVLEEGLLAGIISERDFVHGLSKEGRKLLDQPVSETMTTRVVTVRPEQTIEECMQLMTNGRFRHLPVMDSGRLVGLISIGDVVKAIINEQSSMIHNLVGYIHGPNAGGTEPGL
jgi:CBS domain-containing protein